MWLHVWPNLQQIALCLQLHSADAETTQKPKNTAQQWLWQQREMPWDSWQWCTGHPPGDDRYPSPPGGTGKSSAGTRLHWEPDMWSEASRPWPGASSLPFWPWVRALGIGNILANMSIFNCGVHCVTFPFNLHFAVLQRFSCFICSSSLGVQNKLTEGTVCAHTHTHTQTHTYIYIYIYISYI